MLLFGQPDKVPWSLVGRASRRWLRDTSRGCPRVPICAPACCLPWGSEENAIHVRSEHSVNFKMVPACEEKVLEHRDGHYITYPGPVS